MSAVYFISDAHLGSRALDNNRERETRLVRFLDRIKSDASAIYLLGDMFDFWYEWKSVVPKGYTRFLGKLSELTDSGIEVHYFAGNHDIWSYGYLAEECGVTMHYGPCQTVIGGKKVYLAHGDGLGDPSLSFRFLRGIFHSRVCQFLFSSLPDRLSLWLGYGWAAGSMRDHRMREVHPYFGADKEYLVCWSRRVLESDPDIDFFIYGHRHIVLDETLAKSRVLILGDWITHFTYAVLRDGKLEIKEDR